MRDISIQMTLAATGKNLTEKKKLMQSLVESYKPEPIFKKIYQ